MKKFLLVTFIGMVLAINLYGLINKIMDVYEAQKVDAVDKGYTVVYME